MGLVMAHINENWRIYTILLSILACAALFWLSKYFATKKDFVEHKNSVEKSLDGQRVALESHKIITTYVTWCMK
jgi:hypothetical protein